MTVLEASTTDWIEGRARQLGFAKCGVVQAEAFPELSRTTEWLAQGYAGEMKYLHDARRSDPRSVMAGIHSVIVCALPYNTDFPRNGPTSQKQGDLADCDSPQGPPRGWISRYAWGDDYHEVLRAKLEALCDAVRAYTGEPFEARVYADTGPLNERVLAKHAGLGWLGKNTLLLNEQLGSLFFLGVILTTLHLQPSLAPASGPPPDRCGTCRKCLDACPTGALLQPYVMDARKCISYLTIELRGPIPHDLRKSVGNHIFGCDICQDVCPWNRSAPLTQENAFQPRTFDLSFGNAGASTFSPNLEWLASLSQAEFGTMFRGSALKRAKWRGLLRNVCIALGNSRPGPGRRWRVLSLLSRLACSEEPTISESAQWAISRIQDRAADHDGLGPNVAGPAL